MLCARNKENVLWVTWICFFFCSTRISCDVPFGRTNVDCRISLVENHHRGHKIGIKEEEEGENVELCNSHFTIENWLNLWTHWHDLQKKWAQHFVVFHWMSERVIETLFLNEILTEKFTFVLISSAKETIRRQIISGDYRIPWPFHNWIT